MSLELRREVSMVLIWETYKHGAECGPPKKEWIRGRMGRRDLDYFNIEASKPF